MGEPYFTLKRKLEDLGYNYSLPIEAIPLVECILADLLQTTRSLQHYMDLSKEALMQRDSQMMEAEPYKCDNSKLIQENNRLHRDYMKLREENLRVVKESRRKIKSLSDELVKKDTMISKLQHEIRDLSLRGLCADTLSSRNKTKKKDWENSNNVYKMCVCNERKKSCNEKDLTELTNKIHMLEEKNETYCDEIVLLKSQIEHREDEIVRLNMLLEGGRPITAINKDCCNVSSSERIQKLLKELHEMETINEGLKRDIESALEKQHEAMLRALDLADKNKKLLEEMKKVDFLALKVEEDCNKRISVMTGEIKFLQTRLEGLNMKKSELENQLSSHVEKLNSPQVNELQEALTSAVKENDALHKEIKDLVELNKSLQEKILNLSQMSRKMASDDEIGIDKLRYPTKSELQMLLADERKKNEIHMRSLQEKMTEIMNSFNSHMSKCKDRSSPTLKSSHENEFVRDLHTRLCESEQKILMLKKENDELKIKSAYFKESNKQNYKDVISQLNLENSELSQENIALSKQLSQYKNLNSITHFDKSESSRNDVQKLKDKIKELSNEIQLLKKDKHEYNQRYKESLELAEKLKRDLIYKQQEIEHLEEENCSYKMTSRNGRASKEQLKEECDFLKDQLKKMQTDVVREKTNASQIKNIQMETERCSNELQNELLTVQKKFSLSKDTIESLDRKCKELQSEITALRNEKSNLIDNIKKFDQERDKLVIELDNKTESVSLLEQKLKSQSYELSRIENENSDLKRKLNMNKITEHKLADHETQISFLNGEILRLTQQLDSAIIENKHLQNSLADANGTLKVTRIEHDKSKKEVDSLKQQLQHYVAEIRRIEELLSQKEAERSDMLEHFASLSVEANILENTNHSLESESASKSVQLQSYITKIQNLEEKLIDKENCIETQASRIAAMQCKICALESEVKLMSEEKVILEQNISYLKQMCNNLQSDHCKTVKSMNSVDSELKLYENRIKNLSNTKAKLEEDKEHIKDKLATTERLLSNARKEIVELKLALQDATSETKSLQDSVNRLSRIDIHEVS